ncbi:MAG: glycoside hydrolase family 31 protein [Chloroflexi bacterium]|nr:glycoside hydrolase family 31 protein [Chloroflexota bacterium]
MTFQQEANKLIWEMGQERIQLEAWGPDALRVRDALNAQITDDPLSALLAPLFLDAEIIIGDEWASIRNGALKADISSFGTVRFSNVSSGEELVSETWQRFPQPERRFKSLDGNLFRVQVKFKAYDGERFYGLGQRKHGKLDQKGCVIDLLQLNSKVCIPFLLSNRGYGFLWNNPAVGRVELGQNHTRWIAEATSKLDYWITVGDSPAQIVERYVDATGHAPMLPEWAAGFWQCKLRYETQDELLSVARSYKERGLPLSVIVIDYFHWTLQGEWRFNPADWPDPAGMVGELEEMGIKAMVSVWPTVNGASTNFKEMQRRGLLIETNRGIPAHWLLTDRNAPGLPAPVYFCDATNPEARTFFWQQIREGYHRHGIKTFWLDACEPEMYPTDPENLRYHLGNGMAVTNIYPLLNARGFYEGMKAEGEEEIINLCRSAWAGSQRYGAAVWSGDITSTFEELQAQVRAGMNIGLSGIPWWTTDIGGFHGGDPESPYFRELIVRWFQYGVFCPLFRLHGFREPADLERYWESGGPNEAWSFGDIAYEIIAELLQLRERLRPYIMNLMAAAHERGTPPMRPLFYDFPEDETSWSIEDQFMFGPDLLVAPVLFEAARSRKLYLPAGATWSDAWSGEILQGGNWIVADAPLTRIPLYHRDQVNLPIWSQTI